MKSIVLYQSTAGHTKRYAELIGELIKADHMALDHFNFNLVENYDLIVFGGNLHAVGLNGYRSFKQHFNQMKNKQIIIYAVGATPSRDGVVDEIKSKNFLTEYERNLPLFYLRGGFDFTKLSLKEKILMSLLKMKLIFKWNKTEDELGLLASYKQPLNTVRKENLQELKSYYDKISSNFPNVLS